MPRAGGALTFAGTSTKPLHQSWAGSSVGKALASGFLCPPGPRASAQSHTPARWTVQMPKSIGTEATDSRPKGPIWPVDVCGLDSTALTLFLN